jgi:hypothetical protein
MANDIDVRAENDEYEGLGEYEFMPNEEFGDESDVGNNALDVLGVINL